MRKRRFLSGIVLGALVVAAVGASPSNEASPRANRPSTFIGISPQAPLHRHDLRLMRRTGIGSLRFLIYWSQSEPAPGVFDWAATDEFLTSTSRQRFQRLPVIWGSPSWLARTPRDTRCQFTADRCAALQMPVHSRAQRRAWSTFLRALVGRYGPSGTFWTLHPDLPRDPIRTWQIWNEENDHRFAEASVRGYAALLRDTAPAVRSVDPGARIVLGGLYSTPRVKPSLDATIFLSRLYRQRGIRGLFDGVGLHPYAANPGLMAADISALRAVMREPRRPAQGPLHHRVRLGLTDPGRGRGQVREWPRCAGEIPQERLGNPARKPPALESAGRLLVHLAGHSGRQHPVRLLRLGRPSRPRR